LQPFPGRPYANFSPIQSDEFRCAVESKAWAAIWSARSLIFHRMQDCICLFDAHILGTLLQTLKNSLPSVQDSDFDVIFVRKSCNINGFGEWLEVIAFLAMPSGVIQ